MGKVKVLPPEVVERIAAGEVVERPASVVKELVENSLDAGARRVEAILEGAGLALIAVRDDGEGMSPEDAQLALKRHATSKIRAAADLAAIRSLGFRGEALPSIAAVSRLQLVSMVRGAVAGVKLVCAGGAEPEAAPCAAAPGTLVEVRELFFNTPARFKFLKSQATELKHCVEVLTRWAVIRPDVSFRATSDSRELFTTSGAGDQREVLSLVLGRGDDVGWVPVEAENQLFRVRGWLGPPEFSRPSRNQQIIAINGRWVKSPFLALAVEGGYGPYLVGSRRPVFYLELNVATDQVDVNVHPAKLEVRLSHEQELRAFISHAVREALRERCVRLAPFARMPASSGGETKKVPTLSPGLFEGVAVREHRAVYPETPSAPSDWAAGSGESTPAGPRTAGQPREEARRCGEWPSLTLLGQALATYLVASSREGIYLIDQHAAHERILFERLAAELDKDGVSVQRLAVAQTVPVTQPEFLFWQAHKDTWQRVGFELEEFGADTLLLRAVPAALSLTAAGRLLRELLEQAPEADRDTPWERERHQLLAALACHGAIRAGQTLTLAEGKELITQLAQCRHPYNCPHGRPTYVCLTQRELEKRFVRVLG